jgi:hypothetical protein
MSFLYVFRDECIFTIDPLTARDLDDAVSCKQLDNGNFKIGVHISDVTYFLIEGTPLDKAVANKATSTYLVSSVSVGTSKMKSLISDNSLPLVVPFCGTEQLIKTSESGWCDTVYIVICIHLKTILIALCEGRPCVVLSEMPLLMTRVHRTVCMHQVLFHIRQKY